MMKQQPSESTSGMFTSSSVNTGAILTGTAAGSKSRHPKRGGILTKPDEDNFMYRVTKDSAKISMETTQNMMSHLIKEVVFNNL